MRVAAPAAAQRAVASLAAQQRQPRSFQRLQQPLERRPFVTQCCAVPKPPRRRTRTRWGPSEQGAATSRTRVGDDAFNDESQEPDTLLDWGGDGAAWETSSSAPVLQNGFLSWDDATPPPADDPRDDARDAMYEADADDKPPALADVTPLSRAEQMTLLPFAATGAQYAFYWGAFDTALQRVFASLLGCLLTVDTSPLLAVPFGLYFLWVPVALAGRRNAPLRRYAYAGLWHARVLRVESYASRTPGGLVFDARGDAFLPKRRASEVTRVLVGDDSGARLQLEVPSQPQHADIRVGDDVELVVLSGQPTLRQFSAVREAYLPELGVWLSDYPFLERRAFRAVSDVIAAERERAARQAGAEPRPYF